MESTEFEASEYLAHTLGKFSGRGLSEEERHAAFVLTGTLPNSAVIRDFMAAADEPKVIAAGLPADIAHTLAPLIARLEISLPYAGKFASLFEQRD
ncbi:hypothetical protein [Paraburkholderia largidicola]|uniref:Uncharacterized protein n=1 Tax=Paraburkholderia largidicola TaxID=3014751 RepID=A0A7I8C4H6_9BURK|nr:hypothetical protein [Paraburkholderia sp. PGU16]BCF95371.1 hypothetical protein PPGU16_84380 [Paraburkholderia sp. PGU16]